MKVGFVGAGSMARAMALGWSGAPGGPEAMAFCDLERDRAEALASEAGGEVCDRAGELAGAVGAVVLAVKPAALDDVAAELPRRLPPVISVLAATSLARLERALPDAPVLRLMPNQPVEVNRGVLCYAASGAMPGPVRETLVDLLRPLGMLVELDEEQLDAAMAVMSCSPAYLALVAEALADAGRREGLDTSLAGRLVAGTLAGTAELLAKRGPGAIREAVAPPGGATEAGLRELEAAGVPAALAAAVDASLRRVR